MSEPLTPVARWHRSFRPWHAIVVALVLQLSLLGMFMLYQGNAKPGSEYGWATELKITVIGSVLMLLLSSVLIWLQIRHLESEDRVRQRLLDVINALPDPSALRDTGGRYVLWNRAAEDYHGIKSRHVVGKTPYDIFPKDVAEAILALDGQSLRSGKMVVQRVELPPLYGKGRRVAQIRVAPVSQVSDPTRFRGAVTILHDVTQAERDVTDLLNTNVQLRMVLDASGFGSWTWDLHDNTLSYSTQYEALLRYTGHNFSSDYDFSARLHPSDRDKVFQAGARSIRDNLPFQQVYRLECFDGEYRSFYASGEPTQDETGRRFFTGLLCPFDRPG